MRIHVSKYAGQLHALPNYTNETRLRHTWSRQRIRGDQLANVRGLFKTGLEMIALGVVSRVQQQQRTRRQLLWRLAQLSERTAYCNGLPCLLLEASGDGVNGRRAQAADRQRRDALVDEGAEEDAVGVGHKLLEQLRAARSGRQ